MYRVYVFILWVSCASRHPTNPFWRLFYLFPFFCRFCLVFVFMLSLELCRCSSDLSCPADYVPDLQTCTLRGIEAQSVHAKNTHIHIQHIHTRRCYNESQVVYFANRWNSSSSKRKTLTCWRRSRTLTTEERAGGGGG